jgi:large subunit ribosomal protein L6
MSRIGKKIVVLPTDVEIKTDGNNVTIKGPKGELSRNLSSKIKMKKKKMK